MTDSDGNTKNKYEGCEGITSAAPICDADISSTIINYDPNGYDAALNPNCVKCTKSDGKHF